MSFPASVPECFFELVRFPEDLYENVEKMGLNQRTVKFLLAALNGKRALKARIDLQDIAIARLWVPGTEPDTQTQRRADTPFRK